MSNTRLKTITVEPESVLSIRGGTVLFQNTVGALNFTTGSVVMNGGLTINCSRNSTSDSVGGALLILGGASINGTTRILGDIIVDSLNSTLNIGNRLFVDSEENDDIILKPDGVTNVFEATSNVVTISPQSTIISHEMFIKSTNESLNYTSGGALTVDGGITVVKKSHFNDLLNFNNGIYGEYTTAANQIILETETANQNIITNVQESLYISSINDLILESNNNTIINYSGANLVVISSGNIEITPSMVLGSDVSIMGGLLLENTIGGVGTSVGALVNMGGMVINGNSIFNNVIRANDKIELASSNTFIDTTTDGSLHFTSINKTTFNDVLTINSNGSLLTNGFIISSQVNALVITNQALAQNSIVKFQTADLDSSDSNYIQVYSNDSDYLQLGFNHVSNEYTINAQGDAKNIVIGNNDIAITTGGNILITSPIIISGSTVNIQTGNTNGIIIGADFNSNTITNGTMKNVQVSLPGYSNGNVSILNATSTSNGNTLTIGQNGIVTNLPYMTIDSIGNITCTGTGGTGVTVNNLIVNKGIVSLNISTGSLNATNGTFYNTVSLNSSISNIVSSIASIGTLLSTNASIENISSTMITTGSLSVLNTVITNSSISNVQCTSLTTGTFTILNSTNSVNASTGSIHVLGGVGITLDLHVDGNVYNNSKSIYSSNNVLDLKNTSGTTVYAIDKSNDYDLTISRYSPVSSGTLLNTPFKITGDTNGNSSLILGDTTIGNLHSSTHNVQGNATIGNSIFVNQTLQVNSTTMSINASTGSFINRGGSALQGDVYIGGNTTMLGNLLVNGTTISVNSTNVNIVDNIMTLNSGPTGSSDSGLVIKRYQTDNDSGLGDVISDARFITDTLPDQSGQSTVQIKLSLSQSSVDDYFKGQYIKITSGFSNNQCRMITAYDGITKIATVSSPWTTQNPSIGDSINIYNKPYVGLIYNESSDIFQMASIAQTDSTSLTITDTIPLQVFSITIDSTTNSIGVGSGGSLTVNGGGSFGGDVYLSGSLTNSSDVRLKENIIELPDDILNKIDNIKSVIYNFKGSDISTRQYGFIAQDFLQDFPMLVKQSNIDDYYSLDYQKTTVILMQCVKELKSRIELLEARF